MKKGERARFDEVRDFCDIPNRPDAAEKIVGLATGRCARAKVMGRLKNGVNALRMPVNDLSRNWAYRGRAGLAWNLERWFGLRMPNRERGQEMGKAEFRRFLQAILLLPCQIVRTARRVICRGLGDNGWLADCFAPWQRLQRFGLLE